MIALYDYYQSGAYTFNVSDTNGNTYHLLAQSPYTAAGQYYVALMYMADNPSGGSNDITVTLSPNDGNFDFTVTVAEYAGIAYANLDGTSSNWTDGSTFPASGNATSNSGVLTTTTAPALAIVSTSFNIAEYNPGDLSISSSAGWVRRGFSDNYSSYSAMMLNDDGVVGTGSNTDTWFWINSSSYPLLASDFASVAAAFTISSGGGGAPTPNPNVSIPRGYFGVPRTGNLDTSGLATEVVEGISWTPGLYWNNFTVPADSDGTDWYCGIFGFK